MNPAGTNPATTAPTRPVGAAGAVELVDAIAAAVLACPAVAALQSGGPVVTYLPGRRVEGVRVSGQRVETAIVAAFGVPVKDLQLQVRRAVRRYAPGLPVDIHIADVQLPSDILDQDTPQLALPAGPR